MRCYRPNLSGDGETCRLSFGGGLRGLGVTPPSMPRGTLDFDLVGVSFGVWLDGVCRGVRSDWEDSLSRSPSTSPLLKKPDW